MAKYLITGSEGFLGAHLQMYLTNLGHQFDTLDIQGDPVIIHDITKPLTNKDLLDGYDRVIHLAGVLGTHELFDDVERAIDVNIKGTVNVLEFCRRTGSPFHGITMAHVWENPYETTKGAAERLARAWGREYGFPVWYTTVYNAYGEGQAHGPGHPQKIIPTFARHAHEKKPIPIWGDGQQKVDLVYAADVADALHNCHYEAGSGHARTVLSVAQDVWRIVNKDEPLQVAFHPMRKGEHKPTRDPVAEFSTNPTEPYEKTLARTVWSYV